MKKIAALLMLLILLPSAAVICTLNTRNVGALAETLRFVEKALPGRRVMFYFHTPYYGVDDLLLDRGRRIEAAEGLGRRRHLRGERSTHHGRTIRPAGRPGRDTKKGGRNGSGPGSVMPLAQHEDPSPERIV